MIWLIGATKTKPAYIIIDPCGSVWLVSARHRGGILFAMRIA